MNIKVNTLFILLGTFCIFTNANKNDDEPSKRILYGEDTAASKVPSYVKLEIKSMDFFEDKSAICGGVYVHVKWVLTAAYCLVSNRDPLELIDYYRIEIAMGMTKIKDDPDQQKRECVLYVIHNKYLVAKDFLTYNLALLQVNEPFDLNKNVQVATIAKQSPKLNAHFKVVIAGFGFREVNNYYSPVLKSVSVMAKLRGDQKSYLIEKDKQKPNICVGDFGGPMYLNGELIGIASHYGLKANFFWKDCFTVDGQFVNIQHFIGWINENIEDDDAKSRSFSKTGNVSVRAHPLSGLVMVLIFNLLYFVF